MNCRSVLFLVAAAASVFLPASASAGGFLLMEQSANGTGQGNSMLAAGDDPAAVFYNPAGIAELKGLQLQIGTTMYVPVTKWNSSDGKQSADARIGVQPIPAFFATYKALPWLAAGLGLYTMYQQDVEWPSDWTMNFEAVHSKIRTIQLAPALAFGPFKGFSFGAGADFIFGSMEMTRSMPLGDGQVHLSSMGGSAFAVGWNVGLRYQPHPMVAIGASYRSTATLLLNPGRISFDVPPSFQQALQDQDIYTHLTLPQVCGIGVRVYPYKGMEVEFDANAVGWNSYAKQVVTFSKPLNGTQQQLVTTRNWFDSFTLHLGAKYAYEDLRFLMGISADLNQVPDKTVDPSLPDGSRIRYSLGFAYYFWKMHAGLSYMLVYVFDRSTSYGAVNSPIPGTYSTTIHDVALEVGFHLP